MAMRTCGGKTSVSVAPSEYRALSHIHSMALDGERSQLRTGRGTVRRISVVKKASGMSSIPRIEVQRATACDDHRISHPKQAKRLVWRGMEMTDKTGARFSAALQIRCDRETASSVGVDGYCACEHSRLRTN